MEGVGLTQGLDPCCLSDYCTTGSGLCQPAFASLRAFFSSEISVLRTLTSLATS